MDRYFLLIIVVVASVTAEPNALQDVKDQLKKIRKQTEDVKAGNQLIQKEIEQVDANITKILNEFEKLEKGNKNKTAILVDKVRVLVIQSEALEQELFSKREVLANLDFVNKTLEYSFKITREDVQLLTDRHSGGSEDKCYNLIKEVDSFNKKREEENAGGLAPRSLHHHRGPVKLSSRARSQDSTTSIILISVKIDLAKHELEAALEDKDRLESLLAKKLDLLKGDKAFWEKRLESSEKAVKNTEEQAKHLEGLVAEQKAEVANIDATIAALKKDLYTRRIEWGQLKEVYDLKFKPARECYQKITDKTTALLQVL